MCELERPASNNALKSDTKSILQRNTALKKRQKLTVQDKDQLRELKRSFSQDMYAMAVAYLKNNPWSASRRRAGATAGC